MLTTLINLLLGIKNVFSYILIISYATGKCLISILEVIYNQIYGFASTCLQIVKIVCEDFAVFTTDFLERIYYILVFIGSSIDSVFGFIGSIDTNVRLFFQCVCDSVNFICANFAQFLEKTVLSFACLVNAIKYVFVLIGSGMWFAVTLIPTSVFYLLLFCVYYTQMVFEELFYLLCWCLSEGLGFLRNVKQFFTDVPFEATLGLLFTFCIAYVTSKCYIMIFKFAKRKSVFVSAQLKMRWIELKKRMTEKKVVVIKKIKIEGDDSIYCVICHERQKCVLILPCKHVCICKECQNIMRLYQRKCPVCRTNIERTMNVFV